MAGTVNIGALEGVIAMRDAFEDKFAKLEARTKKAEADVQRLTRTTKSETDKLREAYNKVAASLDPTIARTQKYERSVETLNKALKAGIITQAQYSAQLAKAQLQLQTTTHWTDRLGASIGSGLRSQFTSFFAVSAILTTTIGGIVGITKQAITANIEAEKSSRLVEEAVRRYGERSGVTAEQIADLADEISKLSGLDDELIADAEIVGLKFNRIGSEIFPRFAKVATDLGVSIGDIGAGFEKAGKLVNQPLRALTLFAREGYAVSKSQSDLIKSLVAAGEIEKAQIEILKILESQFGGTAEAARDTMGGALTALGTSWENLLEKMGESSTGPFREAIESMIGLVDLLTNVIIDDSNLIVKTWSSAAVAINIITSAILTSFAELADRLGKLALLFGVLGTALKIVGSDRLRAGAMAADANVLKFTTLFLSEQTEARKRGSRAAFEQTEAESKLNDEFRKTQSILRSVADAIAAYHESLGDTLDTVSRHLGDQLKFSKALKDSEIAYLLVSRAAERANIVEAETLKLTKQHRQEIDKLQEARNKLLALGQKAAADKVSAQIESETKAFQRHIKIIGESVGATFDLKQANEDVLFSIRSNRDWTNDYNTSLAELEDAISGTTSATLANAVALEQERQKLSLNILETEEQTKARLSAIKAIKEQIDAARELTSLRQESEFQRAVVNIDSSLSDAARDIEIQYMDFLRRIGQGSISEGERVLQQLSDNFGVTIEDIKVYLRQIQDAEFVIEVRDTLKTSIVRLNEYVNLVNDSSLNTVEKERLIADARSQFLGEAINDWTSFANTLGSLFGGLFSKIASTLNQISQAYDAGNQLGGLLQKYAGAGSWASGLGMYAAAFTAFFELTEMWTAHTNRQRGRRFTSGFEAEVTTQDGVLTHSGGGARGEALSDQLRSTLDNILDAIGGFVASLPEIEIKIRNDGKKFQLFIAGVFEGIFSSAEEAISVAIQKALSEASFLGVGEEVIHVLELAGHTLNMTIEELLHNLDIAKQTERMRLGDAGADFAEMVNGYLRLIEAQKRLGLSIDATINSMLRSIETEKYRRLGIDTSTADALADLKSFSDGMAQVSSAAQAMVQREIDATMERIRTIEAAMASGVIGGGGSGGGSGGGEGGGREGYTKDIRADWERELADLRRVLAQYTEELGKIPSALSDVEINAGIFSALYRYLEGSRKYQEEALQVARFRVEMEFELIKARLMELGKWEQFQAMFNDAFNAAMAAAERDVRGGGRGGRGGEKESVRDFIADKKFELSLVGLTSYHRSLKEIDKQYDDLLTQAGKDKQLRAELIALRDREIAQLKSEERARVGQEFKDFISPLSAFGEIRKNAEALIASIEQSPFGNARKAAMIGSVMAEVDKQITRLSKEEAAGLFGSMISDLEKFGATEEELSGYRQTLAVIEHTLNVENYRTRIALLKAEGKIGPEIIAKLEGMLGKLANIDPTKLIDSVSGSSSSPIIRMNPEWAARNFGGAVTDTINELNRLADAFKSAKDDIRSTLEEIARGDLGIISPELAFAAAKDQYNNIIDKARGGELVGFQESSEAARNYIESLKRYSPALAAVELPRIQSDLTKLLNSTTVRDENLIYTEKFANNQEQTNKALTAGFTDLSNTSHEQSQLQSQMVDHLSSIDRSQQELSNRLSLLESAELARKIA